MKAHSIKPVGARQLRRRSLYPPLMACAMALGLGAHGQVLATESSGVVGEPVALGDLPEPVRIRFRTHASHDFDRNDMLHGDHDRRGTVTNASTIMMVKYTVAPGGYFGWHRHGGPVWVLIEEGVLTMYDSDDSTCTGIDYTVGTALLDSGDHTHNAVNHGAEPVVVYATFMLPQDGEPRIDAPDPGFCPF